MKHELKKLKFKETIRSIIKNQNRIINKQEFEYGELNTAYMFYDMFKNMDITNCKELTGLSFNLNDQHVLEKNNVKVKTAIDYVYSHKKTLINHLFRLLNINTQFYKNIIRFISEICDEYKIDIANKEILLGSFQNTINEYTNKSIISSRAIQYIESELIKNKNTVISKKCERPGDNKDQVMLNIDYLFKRLYIYDILTDEEKKQMSLVYKISDDNDMSYHIRNKQENITVEYLNVVSPSKLTISDYIYALILLDKAGYYRFNGDSILDINLNDDKKEIIIVYDKQHINKNIESKVSSILMKSFVVKNYKNILLSTFSNTIKSAINKWYMCYYDKNILNDTGITKTDLIKLYILNHYVESNAYENPILDKDSPKLKNISYE